MRNIDYNTKYFENIYIFVYYLNCFFSMRLKYRNKKIYQKKRK